MITCLVMTWLECRVDRVTQGAAGSMDLAPELRRLERGLRRPDSNHVFVGCHRLALENADEAQDDGGEKSELNSGSRLTGAENGDGAGPRTGDGRGGQAGRQGRQGSEDSVQEESGERSASLLDEVGVLFFVHKAREAFRL